MSHEETWKADTHKIVLAWVQSEEGSKLLTSAARAANVSWEPEITEKRLIAKISEYIEDLDAKATS